MNTTTKIAVLIALSVTQFMACKKPNLPAPVEVTTCKITSFTYMVPASLSTTFSAVVKYNSIGNPVSVLFDPVQTANPHALFRYDKFNRLTDHIGGYASATDPENLPPNFIFEYWIRYAYPDDNPSSLPVRDTVRTLGQYLNGVITFATHTTIETIVYDAQSRIVQVNASGSLPSSSYAYDANGNLVLPNITYDDKKNFRQSNKVWMLIDRNYSRNNPFTATQYNSEGYPTLFPAAPPVGSLTTFLRRSTNFKTMDYACSVSSSGAQ